MTPAKTDPTINIRHLGMLLGEAENDADLFPHIVNLPFVEYPVPTTLMFLGIIVLLLVNPKTRQIDRVALSSTEMARRTTEVSAKPFTEIKIDVDDPTNIIAQAIRSNTFQETTNWEDLLTPVLTAEEARLNQANAGIAFSCVHPFTARSGGALIFSYYQYKSEMGKEQQDFMTAYAELVNHRLKQA